VITSSEDAQSRRDEHHGGSGRDLFAGYSKEERPLIAYAELVGLYNLAFAMFLAAAKGAGRPLPQRVPMSDILLVGVATFKLSRLIAKDLVISPLRAPFTTFEGMAGEAARSRDAARPRRVAHLPLLHGHLGRRLLCLRSGA
jgi:hypothetical protein